MKRYQLLFFLMILVISFNFVSANKSKHNLELLGKVIYIDPGHQGKDFPKIYDIEF